MGFNIKTLSPKKRKRIREKTNKKKNQQHEGTNHNWNVLGDCLLV